MYYSYVTNVGQMYSFRINITFMCALVITSFSSVLQIVSVMVSGNLNLSSGSLLYSTKLFVEFKCTTTLSTPEHSGMYEGHSDEYYILSLSSLTNLTRLLLLWPNRQPCSEKTLWIIVRVLHFTLYVVRKTSFYVLSLTFDFLFFNQISTRDSHNYYHLFLLILPPELTSSQHILHLSLVAVSFPVLWIEYSFLCFTTNLKQFNYPDSSLNLVSLNSVISLILNSSIRNYVSMIS